MEAFGVYVSANPKALYYMLVDLVEEDFSQETLPAVRGKDRRSLLERKIAQRYREHLPGAGAFPGHLHHWRAT